MSAGTARAARWSSTCEAVAGKTVASMALSPEDSSGPSYWVVTFTDGSEICFDRLMAEVGP